MIGVLLSHDVVVVRVVVSCVDVVGHLQVDIRNYVDIVNSYYTEILINIFDVDYSSTFDV